MKLDMLNCYYCLKIVFHKHAGLYGHTNSFMEDKTNISLSEKQIKQKRSTQHGSEIKKKKKNSHYHRI